MRFLSALLCVALLGCVRLPSEPICEIEQFGIIKFTNITDEFKRVYVYRVVQDEGGIKKVGKPYQRLIEPMTEGSLRIFPGLVLVIVDKIGGKKWGKVFEIRLCEVVRIRTFTPVAFNESEIKINPRHVPRR